MGEIYLARDRLLGRTVAVKLLAERLAQEPELRERFRREALTAARLSEEPHVVTVYDVGEHAGRPFTVMEYLPGGTLAERAQSRPVEPEQALAWLAQAAAALDAAHGKGVVHRDVVRTSSSTAPTGQVVVDFGIARVTDDTGHDGAGDDPRHDGYLAPEQALGRETTAASDRYALAVVAYELLTGGRPFARGSETAERTHVHDPVPPPRTGPLAPPQVDPVFARALARAPLTATRPRRPRGALREALRYGPAVAPALAPPPQEPAGRPPARRRRPARRGRARRGAPRDARGRSLGDPRGARETVTARSPWQAARPLSSRR